MEFPNGPEKNSSNTEERRRRPTKARADEARNFILNNVEKHEDIAQLTASEFHISRQAANKHLQKLVADGALIPEGRTRKRRYKLAVRAESRNTYAITPDLEEDRIWMRDVAPALRDLPRNVIDIWQFCFTEMLNNAKEHSEGTLVRVEVIRTAANTRITLDDNGIGIFRKIQNALNLLDERHAVIELSKGKLTTDPQGHTGQGIFFTSRLLDSFDILSGACFFTHRSGDDRDWILEVSEPRSGTTVIMKLNNTSTRTEEEVFEQFSSGDGYSFTKTVVPVRIAQYGDDKLVSRSQAKRLLARVDLFKSVILDFRGVTAIGRAFADEIFRVFARLHPDIEITPINANSQVQHMINAAIAHWDAEPTDAT
jgi:anti-sigma regulatory factor (Ser/Thr protein kinase)